MNIKVTNCKNCPFSEYGITLNNNDYANCLFPSMLGTNHIYKIDSYYKNYKSPKWCPLKKVNSLTIEHKV